MGGWHAVVTIGIHTAAHEKHWTVIAHAHPSAPTTPAEAPLAWSADTLLSGSFTEPSPGNYDGKYFQDNGKLYLLYIRNVSAPPRLRNAIVIKPMLSPTQPAPVGPITLLTPGDRNGPLLSEKYGRTQATLVEAPNISNIGGKYALVYSTGAYLTPGYKAAVAWSDTLIPPAGERYRKVLQPDPLHIWSAHGAPEVHYLVQSQAPRWPNFIGDQVIGPGVAAAVQGPGSAWLLYFNGFAPGDMPRGLSSRVDGSHRRPYFLPLRTAVPPGVSVAQATDVELADWLQPIMR